MPVGFCPLTNLSVHVHVYTCSFIKNVNFVGMILVDIFPAWVTDHLQLAGVLY